MIVRDELVSDLRASLPAALIVLDFDGTLAPLVPDPADSRLVGGARTALDALVAAGARIAIVTGRAAATLVDLSGLHDLPGLDVEGLYGAERWHDGALETPEEPAVMAELRSRLPRLIDDEPRATGVWIEDKRLSLVVHARRTSDPAAAIDALRESVTGLADELDLEVHPGRDVLELRLPGFDKGSAVRRLVERYEPDVMLFAGDDVGDLPAFAAIRDLRRAGRRAWSVGVASPQVPEVADAADLAVDGPRDMADLLAQIVAPA